MSFLYRLRAVFALTIKRLWAQRALTLATLFGLTIAVALIMTVPLYADAVYFRILQEELSTSAERSYRPPFAYLYDYVGAYYGPQQWEDVQPMDQYMAGRVPAELGLPRAQLVRHLETDRYRLYPAGDAEYDPASALTVAFFANTTGIEDYIEVVEGALPVAAAPGEPTEVLVAEGLATELGLQAGEMFIAFDPAEETPNPKELPVRVAGIWRPVDANDDFWFFAPEVFDDLLLVPESTFVERLAPALNNEIMRAVWYHVMDGSGVNTTNAGAIASRAALVERRAATLLPEVTNPVSPADGLSRYRAAAEQLTVLLTAFNVPVIGLILVFIALIVGLAVDLRRNELAVIRSRGGTRAQIIGLSLLEGLVLGVAALALGALLALALTQLMGRSRSFLDFSSPEALRVALTPNAWRAAVVAVLLAVAAQVLPTISASRDTIITYKQEQARSLTRPWWQRVWLDLLLLIPAGYGIYQLRQQGSLVGQGQTAAEAPMLNPLLFLIPGLIIVSLTLLFVRVLPWVMAAVSRLLVQTDSVGVLMATRQLARAPKLYAMPLILLVLTAGLAVITASLAQTLDYQLYDESFYRVGSDGNLRGAGLSFGATAGVFSQGQDDTTDARNPAIFLPLDEYRSFPGVLAATRVGRYDSEAQVGGSRITGTYLGIDRADFGNVAFWRSDFAPQQLGALLNALATSPDAVLLSTRDAAAAGFRVGDFLRLTVLTDEGRVPLLTQIVGTFDYFPTWYPEQDGPLVVGNLDALFAQTGGDLPYEVWLASDGQLDEAAFNAALAERSLVGWNWVEPYDAVVAAQRQPDRQGVFGLLSVGFVAAALLTVLGFFIYALFSLRQRMITLGILRAVGLTQRHMTIFLAVEMAVLIVSGLALGTLLGILVSREFIPFWQIGADAAGLAPPYLVEIAWPAVFQIYALFGIMFLVALIVLAALLRRMRIFQAIKLGETV